MKSTDRNVHEHSETYINGVKIRQEDRVPSWGVVHGGVIRHMEFHNTCNGRTFKAVMDVENSGTDAPVQKITTHMELGVEHLEVLIETLIGIRDDQARRAREESDWNAAQAAKIVAGPDLRNEMTINNLRKGIDIAISLAVSHGWEVSEASPLEGQVSLSLNKYDRRIDVNYRVSPTGYLCFHFAHPTYNVCGERYTTWKKTRQLIGTGLSTNLSVLLHSGAVITEPGFHGATKYIRNPDPLPDTIEITECEGLCNWSCQDHTDVGEYSWRLPGRLSAEASARLHLREQHRSTHPLPPATPDQVRDLYRDWSTAAAITRTGADPITKADVLAAIDSYIEAGGDVDADGEPAEWDIIADQLNA